MRLPKGTDCEGDDAGRPELHYSLASSVRPSGLRRFKSLIIPHLRQGRPNGTPQFVRRRRVASSSFWSCRSPPMATITLARAIKPSQVPRLLPLADPSSPSPSPSSSSRETRPNLTRLQRTLLERPRPTLPLLTVSSSARGVGLTARLDNFGILSNANFLSRILLEPKILPAA